MSEDTPPGQNGGPGTERLAAQTEPSDVEESVCSADLLEKLGGIGQQVRSTQRPPAGIAHLAPREIGPYRVVAALGAEQGVRTYLASKAGPDEYLLRVVPLEHDSLPDDLLAEARIAARLSCPSIATMCDFIEIEGHVVMVHRHVQTITLQELMDTSARLGVRVSRAAALYVAERLFSALAHAHGVKDAQGNRTPVVHRDVRPSHVEVHRNGQVKLGGFGMATILSEAREGWSNAVTTTGVLPGGACYLAPEQVDGRPWSEATDVYSAALVVWELLTGRSATPADVANEVLLVGMLANRTVEPLASLGIELPGNLSVFLDACLSLRPADRVYTSAEVAAVLRNAVDPERGQAEMAAIVAAVFPDLSSARTPGVPSGAPASRSSEWRRSGPVQPLVSARPVTMSEPVPAERSDRGARWVKLGIAAGVAVLTAAAVIRIASAPSLGPEPVAVHPVRSLQPIPSNAVPASQPVPSPVVAASGSADSAVGDPPEPPSRTETWLFVETPDRAVVYLRGVPVGNTNQWIRTSCGAKFARLGTSAELSRVRWLHDGLSIELPCGGVKRWMVH
jgi:serine/threonine protein kinase